MTENTHLPNGHPKVASPKIGVVVINLGTPDAPTPSAVKRYLKQFLSDRRVVEIPPIIWQPILRGIILNVRPKKSAHAYQQVWTDKGSPLAAITAAQAEALQQHFGDHAVVVHAMRYGRPAIGDVIRKLKAQGCERILLAPLYPQYSGATTATAQDEAFRTLMEMRWQPAIRTLPPYHDDPAYIEALKISVEKRLATLDFVPDAILASFHGMPTRTLELGDPYHCHCMKTVRLLSEALGRKLEVSFQSRFGRAKWLEPSTEQTLINLPQNNVRKLLVIMPGFAADCLETVEEIGLRGQESFLAAGGTHYALVECLNDAPESIDFLSKIVTRELAGWITAD
ncbi:ferrochelatase [Aquisediminimonas sediminicola]|uniref:ferrochelatase n=1 Tax=Alteraquisediminimonas sediminicola TaxID=2676787 RepID=UPI001C8EF8A8|nr:ferrochelatase [Aquisediminimonas sediminicola]